MIVSAIPASRERTRPLVAVGVLTRNRPGYLARCLEGLRIGLSTTVCDTHLMIWNNSDRAIPEQTHGVGHNVGQHISMNRLIHEASEMDADWFIRIDDDCVFQTRNWLARMVRIQSAHQRIYKRPCVLSPFVHGLRNPPENLADVRIGKFHCHVVEILGGICRMMPMSHLRYWRFDERMPMGWSEAASYAKYCHQTGMPMLRTVNVEVSHGDSTDQQEKEDPDYAYESEMLKMTPYGL